MFEVFYFNKGRWHISPMRGTYEFIMDAVQPYLAQLGHETRVARVADRLQTENG